jgi:hypothetical protein
MPPPSSGSKVNKATNYQKQAASLLGLLFNPEDASDVFLRNVRLSLVTTQKTIHFMITNMRTSNLAKTG